MPVAGGRGGGGGPRPRRPCRAPATCGEWRRHEGGVREREELASWGGGGGGEPGHEEKEGGGGVWEVPRRVRFVGPAGRDACVGFPMISGRATPTVWQTNFAPI
jgi:hypothetical protein